MAKKRPPSAGQHAVVGSWVLIGSYAGSPFDWWIAPVLYTEADELCIRNSSPGGETGLQIILREIVRAVSNPTALQAAAEGGAMEAAVKELVAFRQRAENLWGRSDETIREAEKALQAARDAKWATLDSLFQTEPVAA